jgi:tetratricopeptide (TPR) repeat protein
MTRSLHRLLTMCTRSGVLLAVLLAAARAEPEIEPLQVRLGALSRHTLVVLGLEDGQLRLRPVDTAHGEILVSLREARGLQFKLPERVGQAQQLAFHHRPSEAIELLRPLVAQLVPLLEAPGNNGVPVVQQYLDLLLARQHWNETAALAEQLPPSLLEGAWAVRIVQLAYGLHRSGQPAAAAGWTVRLQPGRDPAVATLVDEFAHLLRREGHYADAQRIYERLQESDPPDAVPGRRLLLAYVAAHQGEHGRVEDLLSDEPEILAPVRDSPLYLLLRGGQQLAASDPAEALDRLSRGLIGADGASEWRLELQASLAAAYRANGRLAVAEAIEAGLRRLHPESRWTPPLPALAVVSAGDARPTSP